MSLSSSARPTSDPAPQDSLSTRDFARLAETISAVSGIKLPPGKRTMLEGRLRRRVRATGCGTFDGYCDWLFSDDNLEDEQVHLINAVTTNTTAFFREAGHFDYLESTILPEIAAGPTRRIRAWSAACSTGAEPYTLAMVLDQFARETPGASYGILATDLDTEMLEIARRGVYPADAVAPVPALLRERCVRHSHDARRREVRIAPALRSAIGFARLNLMDDTYPVGASMDLIFCRNVLIYFDRAAQSRVIKRLVDCLAPGGHLVLGHSESIAGFDVPLRAVANTVFRRI